MPADKRLIECPSCYATKGQYHKPGCPALTPPADPATACLCGSPYADWTANGKLMCARCAANFVAASRFSADPAAVPPPDHPAPRQLTWKPETVASVLRQLTPPPVLPPPPPPDGLPPPPDWASEAARAFNLESGTTNEYYPDVYERDLARLLASVREGAIEECKRSAAEFAEYCDATAGEFGARGDWANAESWLRYGRGAFMFRTARLDALLDTPPSGEGGA